MELVDIKTIIPNPNNPRIIRDERFLKLVKSIKDFPEMLEIRPIVVNQDMVVLGGNMRLKALKEAGVKKVQIIKTSLTDDKQREFIIKDNLGFGEWDWQMIANEWDAEQVIDWGLEIPDFSVPGEVTEDDYEIPEQVETDIVLGDLFEIGPHRLLCGDSTDMDSVAKLMLGQKADMLFTDPPYGVDYDGGHFHSGDVNIKRPREKLKSDNSTIIYNEFLPAVLPFINGPCYMWFASSKSRDVYNALHDNNTEIHALIIWHKTNATYAAMNAQYKQRHEPCIYFKPHKSTLRWCGATTESTIWELPRDGQNTYHPTQKPVSLSAKAIQNHSVGLILDVFMGSGSTMVAAHQLNRKCYGMELDPKYCQIIVDRMLKLDPTLEVKLNGKPYAIPQTIG